MHNHRNCSLGREAKEKFYQLHKSADSDPSFLILLHPQRTKALLGKAQGPQIRIDSLHSFHRPQTYARKCDLKKGLPGTLWGSNTYDSTLPLEEAQV